MKSQLFSLSIACIFLLVSCAHNPEALQVASGMIPDYYSINNELTLLNKANDERLKTWTNSLIVVLSSELKKKGATISDGSSDVITLDIYDTFQNFFHYYFAYKCKIHLKVETSSGYSKNFIIEDVSGSSLQKACGFCLTKATAELLNDRDFLKSIGATIKPF